MELAPGTVFASDYEVQRELSAGGMGRVYVVLQRSTGKLRALKLMLPQLVSDPSLRRRFEQEARVASLIESDHVVEVVGAGIDETSGAPWLAMELLRGGELTAAAVAAAGQPLATTHTLLRQVCHAVGAAHAAGIVHRDLKPENIFLAESKRAGEQHTVKVLDFGIAKIAAEASTQHTAAMGSPIWMAPEQSDKGAITPAADVWALGLVTYHLLTGKFFWRSAESDGTIHQVMREVLFEPIPLASQRAFEQGVAAALPPWFDAWFARCLNRDPLQRYPDARALFAAFDAYMNGHARVPTVMAAPTPQTVMATPTPQTVMAAPTPQTVMATPVTGPPPAYSATPSVPVHVAGMTAPAVSLAQAITAPPPQRRAGARVLGLALLVVALLVVGVVVKKKLSDRVEGAATAAMTSQEAADSDSADNETPEDDTVEPSPTLANAPRHPKRPPRTHHGASPPASGSPSASASGAPSASAAPIASVPESLASAIAAEASNTPPPVINDEGGFARPLALEKVNAVDLQACADEPGAVPGTRVFAIYDDDGVLDGVQFEPVAMRGTPAARCVEQRLVRHKETRIPRFHGQKRRVMRVLF